MSPNEQEILVELGQNVFSNTLGSILGITGYGAFVLGTIIAILLLSSPTNFKLLACLIVIFIGYTWEIFYAGGFVLTQIQYGFIKILPEGGLGAQVLSSYNHLYSSWEYMMPWPMTINILLSDCIVAWRAWILFEQERFWRFALVILIVANIGVNIADCVWSNIQSVYEVFDLLEAYNTSINAGLNQAYSVISVVFGIVAASYPVAVIILILKDASPVVEIFNQSILNTPQVSDITYFQNTQINRDMGEE
ncbi:hypothetical protein C8R42DRAFT_648902 [Lentinula raphanica]|nr:hypothetical protein C8R42DRAFT_648902 [Lentinula raphanica]